MSNFKYQHPSERGMVKLPITLRKLYKMGLAFRGTPILVKADVYANASSGVIEYRTNLFGKIVLVFIAPIIFIVNGFNRHTTETIKCELLQTKCGTYSCDTFNRQDKIGMRLCDMARKIMKCAK
jgi:hypothetical protein